MSLFGEGRGVYIIKIVRGRWFSGFKSDGVGRETVVAQSDDLPRFLDAESCSLALQDLRRCDLEGEVYHCTIVKVPNSTVERR